MPAANGEWVELSHSIQPDAPRMPVLPRPAFERLEDAYNRVTEIRLAMHVGTHIEAPDHVLRDGRTIDDYPIERWITRATTAQVDVGPSEPISLEMVRGGLNEDALPEVLFVAAGWDAHAGTETYAEYPYFEEPLAEWIVDAGFEWVGIDFPSPENAARLGEADYSYPIHTRLLENDVLIAENLRGLDALPPGALRVIALPLLLEDTEASPVRVVARPLDSEP